MTRGQQQPATKRKAYVVPEIRDYGPVVKLTRGGVGSGVDGNDMDTFAMM